MGAQILTRVGETLQAASSDPEVTEAIERGRLSREQRAASIGLVGPATLPPDIAASLGKLFLDAIADPSSKPVLDSRGLVAVPQDGPAFKAQIMKDRERWAAVVKAGNIKAE